MEQDWRANLLTGTTEIGALLERVRRVAVLGMRSEDYAFMPAHFVAASLAEAGLEIVPVPVYERERTHMLGRLVYRRLAEIPGPVDLVDVFRRSPDIPRHVDDILAKRPLGVWFQSGIRNDTVAERLAREGIKVVQSRCLMVDYRSAMAQRRLYRS